MTTGSATARRAFTGVAMFVFTSVIGVAAAVADAPAGPDWPVAEGRSVLDTLLIFGGGTIGLFLLVALFGLMTARTNYVPPPPSQELATLPGNEADVHH